MTPHRIRACFPLRRRQILAGLTGVVMGAWLGFSLIAWRAHTALDPGAPLTSTGSPAALRNPTLSSTAIPFGRAS